MDGTKGQVLTKQSETNGDANWEDIEANEVFVGNEEEAPNSAKIIVEEDDFVEGSTLGKAEVYVGAEEPTTGEKVWFNKDKNSIYVRNSNGVYEEFAKKSEEVYSTEEQKIGTWIDGKPLYRKIISSTLPKVTTDGTNVASTVPINANIDFGYIEKAFYTDIYSGRITLPWITGSGRVIRAYLDVPGQQISLLSNTVELNEQPVTIIVCYTKTTD